MNSAACEQSWERWHGRQINVTQTSANCSLLQAAVASPKVIDFIEANIGLPFLKHVAKDFKNQIQRHHGEAS